MDKNLYHSDTFLGAEFTDGLKHWKYIKKEKRNGKWRYYYKKDAPKKYEYGSFQNGRFVTTTGRDGVPDNEYTTFDGKKIQKNQVDYNHGKVVYDAVYKRNGLLTKNYTQSFELENTKNFRNTWGKDKLVGQTLDKNGNLVNKYVENIVDEHFYNVKAVGYLDRAKNVVDQGQYFVESLIAKSLNKINDSLEKKKK